MLIAASPTLSSVALQLRDILNDLVATDQIDQGAFASIAKLEEFRQSRANKEEIVVDVMKWVNRLALVRVRLIGARRP